MRRGENYEATRGQKKEASNRGHGETNSARNMAVGFYFARSGTSYACVVSRIYINGDRNPQKNISSNGY